jgi:predicted HNH restriction endonuclease
MIVSSPVLRTATAPLINGTTQYEVSIIDCSQSGHGSADTRYISSGNWDDGVGKGVFRLYVNKKGAITGYTWSTYSSSVYYSQSERQLAVGEHVPF